MKTYKWFFIALVAVMLAAPNATIIRSTVLHADPFYFTMCRFILIGLVCLPFIIRARKTLFAAGVRRDVIIASISLSIALIAYALAILHSQASYVSIITLASPIIFIALSSKLFHEKLNRRMAAGITLAMIGAMTLIVLPIALSQNGTAFYPLATILALTNSVGYTISIIFMRRANEHGVTMPSIIGVSAWFAVAVSLVLFVLFGDKTSTPTDVSYWLAVGYSGIVVALVGRALNVWSYEHVGAVVMSALGYLETLVAILIPVAVLNEKLSPEMVIGGVLILFGVYIVEHHKHPHAKHHIIMRHQ
jgi:drug/metabolite transporter (DMT)-like permease